MSLFCLCFHSLSELCKVLRCKFNDIYDLTLTHLSPAVTCVCEDMQACYTVTYKCARTDTLPHRPKHRQTHTHTSRCNMHAGIINRDGKWCCCRQALRERGSDIRTDLKEGQRVEECRKTAKKKVFWTKRSGWCFALQNNKWIYVRARACVYFAQWDQMKYSSVSVAIDQSSAAPMMDTTALIAPPMPSVSLTHTLLHSHSFIYLSPFFFPPSVSVPSLSPPALPTLQHTNRNKSQI